MRPATTIKVRTEEPDLIFRTYSGQEQLSKEEIKVFHAAITAVHCQLANPFPGW